jgi:hypothetical protein
MESPFWFLTRVGSSGYLLEERGLCPRWQWASEWSLGFLVGLSTAEFRVNGNSGAVEGCHDLMLGANDRAGSAAPAYDNGISAFLMSNPLM